MKTSILALSAAFALTLGATSVSFAQETPTTPEECLVEQGAGAPAPGESLSPTTGDDDDDGSSEGPEAEGLEKALGQEIDCHDVTDSDD